MHCIQVELKDASNFHFHVRVSTQRWGTKKMALNFLVLKKVYGTTLYGAHHIVRCVESQFWHIKPICGAPYLVINMQKISKYGVR